MTHTSPLRIALIGLGDIAQKAYLPIMAAYPGVEPILCTRDERVLTSLAKRYRIRKTCTTVDDLIAQRPDAAMVHTSTESHVDITTKLLEAGIPVFVDKPLSYSLAGAEQILEVAERQGLPLFVGFNRRYAPLISSLRADANTLQVNWQKNRVDLPGDIRHFIFDDFIHVVDGLRFLAPGPATDLTVHSRLVEGKLANLQVRWTREDCLLTGGMNRISGVTEERIEYFTPDNTWLIEDLHRGSHFQHGKTNNLSFGHWEPTLVKRGFVAMLDHWIATVRNGGADSKQLEDIRLTHALCETIVERVLRGG
ncbi:virulence factor [Lewinella aquimaris]|uniref:Virulence factor n=1 Tax=Neolewinella aquimaris TaxID=1835722 RepID=A0A840E6U5_9BACT|nr:Gfo/Idh/MocA family oxidoreductase [Neolewinella aquimaris]MBB4079673.1 virulence factor [Neolewinella aquimaris]